jgi:undecaprenyl-diphosphatase
MDLLKFNSQLSAGLSLLRRTEARLLLAVFGALSAVWAFLALTDEVREGDTSRFDRDVLLAFRVPGHVDTPIGPRWLQESARDVTALGGFTTLSLIVVMSIAILWLHGRRTQANILLAAVLVAQACSAVLKIIIDRPRPTLVPYRDLVYSSSFPSGHAMMTPVVYLTLAAIVSAGDRDRAVKILLLVAAIFLTVAVGVSRVYLGVHWPSDVLAGWTLGSAIALTAAIVLFWLAQRQDLATEIKPDVPHP